MMMCDSQSIELLNDSQRGLANYHPKVDEDALEYFATQSQGDVRSALNAL